MSFFIVSTKCLKSTDGEEMKLTREKYLVNAMTVTEAEAKIVKWFPDNHKDLSISIVSMFDLDVIITEGDFETYYLGRIAFPEEGKKGKIKMVSFQVMVNGDNLANALKSMKNYFEKDSALDYTMRSISDSQIIVDHDLVHSE